MQELTDFWHFGSVLESGCGRSSVVEHLLAKQEVEGSSPFARSSLTSYFSLVFLIVLSTWSSDLSSQFVHGVNFPF